MTNLFLLKLNCFKYFSSFILVLLIVFSADFALAHRVVIFAWIEGDTVFTESQFPDGKKISDAPIKVFDVNSNTLLLEGKTNANGEFSFKIPEIAPLHIVLEAGMGHQGQWDLTEAEIIQAMGPGQEKPGNEPGPASPSMSPQVKESIMESAPDPSQNQDAPGGFLAEHQLENIIDKALDKKLDKKLQPIMRSLAYIQQPGPTVHDILGGIGYIFGLMGVAAYILSRKK